ncbi:hypothetical protein QBC40DRAFT_27918 [Triangularia verruculosa]|uniref:Uncharacterized protein n=1 Tax=Triangularia verruculosa TaxID=2587418 RepID=A0AAN7AQK2_9PEZI|nr:hypothetical protein QBC40DRAFT_27918 [Triangularia verruculosa]
MIPFPVALFHNHIKSIQGTHIKIPNLIMHRNNLIIVLVGALSLATAHPGADPIDAILRARQVPGDAVPTTTTFSTPPTTTEDGCLSTIQSLLRSPPTPHPQVLSWEVSRQNERLRTRTAPTTPFWKAGVEGVPSFCSSLFAETGRKTTSMEPPPATVIDIEVWHSFTSAAVSWSSSIRPIVHEVARTCSSKYPKSVGPMMAMFIGNEEECNTVYSLILGAVPATETGAETGTETSSGQTATETEAPAEETTTATTLATAGAARETGYVVAVVVAAVGVAGVMGAM